MQPFDSFTLDQFRGLAGLSLEGLGRVNILVGSNNSGKSSILEALELACDPLGPLNWIAVADQRDIRSNAIDRIDNVLWMFPRGIHPSEQHRPIELSFSGSLAFLGLTADPQVQNIISDGPFIGSVADDESKPARRILRTTLSLTPRDQQDALPSSVTFSVIEGERFVGEKTLDLKLRTPCASIAPLSHRVRSIHAERLSQAKESGLVGDAVALLQHFDPEIQDLDILARQGTFADVRIRHKTLGLAPLNAFGDGLRRALLYALTLPQVRGGVLLIDEIESAIHVKALAGVFTWLTNACEQFDVQLFASTHSLEALESLLGDDAQTAARVVGFHLPNRSTGAAVTRYEGELLARLVRDRGLDVR